MLKNDNDKKYAVFASVLALILLTLVSCGRQMQAEKLTGGAHDVAFRIYKAAGEDSSGVYEEALNTENSYIFGIAEDDLLNDVEEASVFRPSALAGGRALCVIVAKDETAAERLYSKLYEEYDWAPCDPADSMAFMRFGRYVVTVKDEHEQTAKLCRAFSAVSDGGAVVRFSENPM